MLQDMPGGNLHHDTIGYGPPDLKVPEPIGGRPRRPIDVHEPGELMNAAPQVEAQSLFFPAD